MKPVLRLLLLTLAAFLGSLFASPDAQAVSWKTAPDEIFSGTLEDAGENGPSAREQCRINGWLNYDTTSEYTVAARNQLADTSNLARPLGRGTTGRTAPASLTEQLAMKQAMSNPAAGMPVRLRGGMNDPRWPAREGWVKMRQNVNGVEIHYVRNTRTGAVDDFKFSP